MDLYAEMKKRGASKEEFLKEAVKLQGVYVPAFYEVKYNEDGTISELCKLYEGAPDKVKRAILPSVQDSTFPTDPIIPMVEAVHDRAVVETFRGMYQRLPLLSGRNDIQACSGKGQETG